MRAITLAAVLFLLTLSAGCGSSGGAVAVSGSAALTGEGRGAVNAISCAAPGDCAAGGNYNGGSYYPAFVLSDANGSWGNVIKVQGAAGGAPHGYAGDLGVSSISCAAAGDCAAGGWYTDGSSKKAFVVDDTSGSWGHAIDVPGLAITPPGQAKVNSISCAAPRECAAGGYRTDHRGVDFNNAFMVNQTNGTWRPAIAVSGLAALEGGGQYAVSEVDSISCARAGDCAAAGYYSRDASVFSGDRAFLVNEKNGSWGNAINVPGLSRRPAGLNSISCAAAGECAAGGDYTDRSSGQAFVVNQTNGTWGHAIEVPGLATLNTGADAAVNSISCAAAGECAAGGVYSVHGSRTPRAFVVSETNGRWGNAIEVPGAATLYGGGYAEVDSISCAKAGDCTAAGFSYRRGQSDYRPFVVSETNGRWGNAITLPGTVTSMDGTYGSISISCSAADACTAGGSIADNSGRRRAFVVSETNGSWGKAIRVGNFPA